MKHFNPPKVQLRLAICVLPFILIFALASRSFGQGNFQYVDKKVFWQHVYEDSSDVKSRVDKFLIVNSRFLSAGSTEDQTILLDMKDYVYEKEGYNCSGRVVIEVKDNKYRVSVYDISYKPGAKGKTTSAVFLGSSPDYIFHADDAFIKKGTFSKSNRNINLMDSDFSELFKFKELTVKDW